MQCFKFFGIGWERLRRATKIAVSVIGPDTGIRNRDPLVTNQGQWQIDCDVSFLQKGLAIFFNVCNFKSRKCMRWQLLRLDSVTKCVGQLQFLWMSEALLLLVGMHGVIWGLCYCAWWLIVSPCVVWDRTAWSCLIMIARYWTDIASDEVINGE
jgi:hypothetical protein